MQAFAAHDSAAQQPDSLFQRMSEFLKTGEFRKEGKIYVLTAARYHQMSWGTANDSYNFFVKYLTDGITMTDGKLPADANGDGAVSRHELFLYIKAHEEDEESFVFQNVQEYPLNSDYVLFGH